MSVAAATSAAAPRAPRPPVVERAVSRVRAGVAAEATRVVPEETPVALVFDGATEAVMMATPADLDDFARGFAFTEGLAGPGDLRGVEAVETPRGIELRLWLAPGRSAALAARRRRLAGATGCGSLAGTELMSTANSCSTPVCGWMLQRLRRAQA